MLGKMVVVWFVKITKHIYSRWGWSCRWNLCSANLQIQVQISLKYLKCTVDLKLNSSEIHRRKNTLHCALFSFFSCSMSESLRTRDEIERSRPDIYITSYITLHYTSWYFFNQKATTAKPGLTIVASRENGSTIQVFYEQKFFNYFLREDLKWLVILY